MPGIARFNDTVITGHACDFSASLAGVYGSGRGVFVNSKGIQVKGDPLTPHTILIGDTCVLHAAFITGGSSSVYAGGLSVARQGDSADEGIIAEGSFNVFAGG